MQCLSQLITKEQTHLSKGWGTVQTCREENAILLFWSQDKYYFNFHEFLKLSRACDIVQKNIAKISLFVMFIYFFLFLVSTFYFYFFDNLSPVTHHPPPATRHPLPATRHPSPAEKSWLEKMGYFDRVQIALQFRYTFYWPQTKRLRARKIGFSCLGRPSGDVPFASEDMACSYWFSKWRTTKSIWVR